MAIDFQRLGPLALGLAALSACTTSETARLGADEEGWGEANRQTMMAQIIDPAPHYDYAVPESSGEHTADALERYRNGTVKRPDRVTTTNISIGSGTSGN